MKVRATIEVVHRVTTYVKDKRYALNIFCLQSQKQ